MNQITQMCELGTSF